MTGPSREEIDHWFGDQKAHGPRRVRFLNDDPGGLWRADDLADDIGLESPGTTVRLLRLVESGEVLALDSPYERNLIEGDIWQDDDRP